MWERAFRDHLNVMKKQFLQKVVLVLLISSINGNGYCSRNENNIQCVPCSTICSQREACKFKCPKQCGPNAPNKCHVVCAWQCRNRRCEYDEQGGLKCAEGCLDGLSGKYCQEPCPESCSTCDRFSLICTTCKSGFHGENCNERDDTNDTTVTPNIYEDGEFPHTLVSCVNASCDQNGFNNTTDEGDEIKESRVLLVLIFGIAAAVIFIAIVALVSYKLTKRHKRQKREQVEEHDLENYRTYDYIDDSALALYYASLKRQAATQPVYQGICPKTVRGTHAVRSSVYGKYLTPLK